jgi:hypothetical protein
VHTLLRKAKRHHLDKASDFVIAALDLQETARRDPRLLDARLSPEVLNSRLEALQKALAVQESTQRLPEWPFAISTTFAFVGTVGTVLAQVAYAWGQQIANALPFHW